MRITPPCALIQPIVQQSRDQAIPPLPTSLCPFPPRLPWLARARFSPHTQNMSPPIVAYHLVPFAPTSHLALELLSFSKAEIVAANCSALLPLVRGVTLCFFWRDLPRGPPNSRLGPLFLLPDLRLNSPVSLVPLCFSQTNMKLVLLFLFSRFFPHVSVALFEGSSFRVYQAVLRRWVICARRPYQKWGEMGFAWKLKPQEPSTAAFWKALGFWTWDKRVVGWKETSQLAKPPALWLVPLVGEST